jgi:hypothetical protein
MTEKEITKWNKEMYELYFLLKKNIYTEWTHFSVHILSVGGWYVMECHVAALTQYSFCSVLQVL